jgi:hypothetical protein
MTRFLKHWNLSEGNITLGGFYRNKKNYRELQLVQNKARNYKLSLIRTVFCMLTWNG